MTAYKGDLDEARQIVQRVLAGQADAKANGRADAMLVDGEQVLVDAVDFFLRGVADAEFDRLTARGRELQLQPQDIVEIMEWKGLSALRAGRRDDGIRFLDQALAEADKTTKVAADRLRLQIARQGGSASPSQAAGGG